MDQIFPWGRHALIFKGILDRSLEIISGIACAPEISFAIAICLKYFVG